MFLGKLDILRLRIGVGGSSHCLSGHFIE